MDAQAPLVRRVHQASLDLRDLTATPESRERQESPDIPVFRRSRSARETRESRASREFPDRAALPATTASQALRARRARSVTPVSTARRALLEGPAPKDTLETPDHLERKEHPLPTSTLDQKETKAFPDRQASPAFRDSKVKQENQDFQDPMDRPATPVSPQLASKENKEMQD